MKKQKKPSFYAFYKDFNTGAVKPVNVLEYVFDEILTERGAICKKHFCIYDDKTYKRIPITTKEQLAKRINSILIYWFSTTMSSLFFGFQPLTIALKASFLGMKWFIVFWSTKYICSRLEEATWKSTSRIVHELTIIFGIVENWYWIHNIKHVLDRKSVV